MSLIFASPLPGVLGGGRMPAFWKRSMEGSGRRLGDLARLAMWVERMEEVRPRLSVEPIFGVALAELTSISGELHTELPPGGKRRADRQPGKAQVASQRRARKAEAVASAMSRERGVEAVAPAARGSIGPRIPLGHRTHVARGLLRRLAGESVDLAGSAAASLDDAKSLHGRSGAPVRFLRPAIPRRSARRRWQERKLERIRRTLAGPPERRLREAETATASPSQHRSKLVPSDPWKTPLRGPTVPFEVLGVAASPVRTGPAGARSGPEGPSPSGDDTLTAVTPASPGSFDRPWTGLPEMKPGSREWSEDPAVRAPTMPPASAAPPDQERGSAAPPPAAIKPTEPASLTLPGPDRPVIVRPAKAVKGGREAAQREDDMERLAGRMKRILDEEARRHGIDV